MLLSLLRQMFWVRCIDANTTVLFAADNVDHNIITLDGKGTFHGMGMIAAMTPAQKTSPRILRQKTTELSFVEVSKVAIVEHRFAKHVGQVIKFRKVWETSQFSKM